MIRFSFVRFKMAVVNKILFVAIFSCVLCLFTNGERHTIKIVEEPSSYGMMNSYQGGLISDSNANKLKMRVQPSNFSGPALFKRMIGKCFSKTDENYKYELCPFSNVTQHEQSLRWNPYSGILGVWQEWEIKNNTFVAMVMREGDKCGDKQRTMKVFFVCGKENAILNVTEPSTCNYHMNVSSPYVCHPHAMLVYPTLSKQLQADWGRLEGELANKEITNKGYQKYLKRIFVQAGYMLSDEDKGIISAKAVEKEKKAADGSFDNLHQCTEEYRKLKEEFDNLQALVNQQHDMEAEQETEMDDHGYAHMMDD